MSKPSIHIDRHGATHALVLRDRGARFTLFVAASTLSQEEQRQACKNVLGHLSRVDFKAALEAQGRTAP